MLREKEETRASHISEVAGILKEFMPAAAAGAAKKPDVKVKAEAAAASTNEDPVVGAATKLVGFIEGMQKSGKSTRKAGKAKKGN